MLVPKSSGGSPRTPSELELQSNLKELHRSFEVEAVQTTDTARRLETQIVGQVPILHRIEPFELATIDLCGGPNPPVFAAK